VSTAAIDGTATPSTSSCGYFGVGLGLFALAAAVFAVTGNPILIPTVALIGNFWCRQVRRFFYERRHMSQVTLVRTARAFLYRGVRGRRRKPALLEPVFISSADVRVGVRGGFMRSSRR